MSTSASLSISISTSKEHYSSRFHSESMSKSESKIASQSHSMSASESKSLSQSYSKANVVHFGAAGLATAMGSAQVLFPRAHATDYLSVLMRVDDARNGIVFYPADVGKQFYIEQVEYKTEAVAMEAWLASDPTSGPGWIAIAVPEEIAANTTVVRDNIIAVGDNDEAVGIRTDAAGTITVRIVGYYRANSTG